MLIYQCLHSVIEGATYLQWQKDESGSPALVALIWYIRKTTLALEINPHKFLNTFIIQNGVNLSKGY